MKKIFSPLFAAGLIMITWQTSFADLLVLDVNGSANAPNNPQILVNSNPDTELAWAKLLTGDSTLTFLERIEFEDDDSYTTFVEKKDLTSEPVAERFDAS